MKAAIHGFMHSQQDSAVDASPKQALSNWLIESLALFSHMREHCQDCMHGEAGPIWL